MRRREKPRRKQRDPRGEPTRRRRRPETEYRRLTVTEIYNYLALEEADPLAEDAAEREREPSG